SPALHWVLRLRPSTPISGKFLPSLDMQLGFVKSSVRCNSLSVLKRPLKVGVLGTFK
ncbi:hypothetical protein MMC12_007919, partial [Toensbergia leucococca]|nr:hypothetical protein [Toensbergia leucococca]